MIIPITISFIEGRIPPFISPIYSPCETIEMVKHHGNKADLPAGLHRARCHRQHRPEQKLLLIHIYRTSDSATQTVPFLRSTPKNARLGTQQGCFASELWNNQGCRFRYIHAGSCPFLPFHPGRDAECAGFEPRCQQRTDRLFPQLADPACAPLS